MTNSPRRRILFDWKGVIILAVVVFLFELCSCTTYATEIRAVWVHIESQFSADPEKGRQEIDEFISRLSDANINVVLPWVRSEYVAAISDEAYREKVPMAAWDALGELVKAADQKGIKTHIWYSFTNRKSPTSPEFNPKHGGDPEWATRQLDELLPNPATGTVEPRRMENICLLRAASRKWEWKWIETILNRYPLVSGVHIEEPGYNGNDNCVCDLCIKVFALVYGSDLTADIKTNQAENLRCMGTTALMRELHQRMTEKNPQFILSANGGWSWRNDRYRGRDWKHWANFGWLGFYAPQIYTADMAEFEFRAKTTIDDLGKDCPVVVGIGAGWSVGKTNTTATIINQVETARKLGAKGVVFFHGKALTDELLQALKAGPFKER